MIEALESQIKVYEETSKGMNDLILKVDILRIKADIFLRQVEKLMEA